MNNNGIEQMLSTMRATATQAAGKPAEPGGAAAAGGVDFASVLKSSIEQVNQTQQEAANLAENFAAGEGDANLHDVMIALQKASVSFQEMVQVRNKLVSAYQDVMNMPV